MTFKEKLEKEHPNKIVATEEGDCVGCPQTYGYEEKSECEKYESCEQCWCREIPGTEKIGQFTKSDLKDGMRVVYRDGRERTVFKEGLCKIAECNGLDCYNEELMYALAIGSGLDIVKVYEDGELIWEREEAKKMTHAEIEKALGYKFELVEGE